MRLACTARGLPAHGTRQNPSATRYNNMRILFVENNATFAALVIKTFLPAHEVEVVPTLVAARKLLAAGGWDVALVDFDLDDGKGIELVNELANRNPRPYVVAVSAFDEKNATMKAAGADAICGKLQFSRISEVLAVL